MKKSLLFKQVLILGISLLFCCNVKCQNNVSSCKTYKLTRKIIFHPAVFLQRTGLHIMSFDYDNNKCLDISYPNGSFTEILEHNFKQIGDTLFVYEEIGDDIEDWGSYLIKGNRIYLMLVDGTIGKRSRGLKLINNKAISRLQEKYKNSFKYDHIIIEDSCFRLDKQQK